MQVSSRCFVQYVTLLSKTVVTLDTKALALTEKMLYNTGDTTDMEIPAGVMELADVTDSKSVPGNRVWVRVPPPAPRISQAHAKNIFSVGLT